MGENFALRRFTQHCAINDVNLAATRAKIFFFLNFVSGLHFESIGQADRHIHR